MARLEERVNKRGRSWKLTWYYQGKRQPPLTFTNKLEAQQWEAALEIHKGDANAVARAFEKARSSAPSFQEAAEHHLDRLRSTPLTKQTYQSYLRNHLTPAFGSAPVDTLTDDDVRHLIKIMENKSLSVKMITSVLGFFNGVLDHAKEQGWVTQNPYHHKMLPHVGVRDERNMFLTMQEATLIISHLRPLLQNPCRTLLATGLRPAEMRALNVEDIILTGIQPTVRVNKAMKDDRENGEYVGPPKSKASVRSVAIPPSSLPMFIEATKGRGPTEPLFVGSTGNRLNGSSVRRAWRAAVAKAQKDEDEPLTKTPALYSLRHTYASLMLSNGMDIFRLAKTLGHGDVKVTQSVYAHLMPTAFYDDAQISERAFHPPALELT